MKKVKNLAGIAVLLATVNVHAEVNVSFDRDVELLAVNGKELGLLSSTPSKLQLENGPNQLITRVSKLVSYHGEFKKFLTKPVVLTFNVSDSDLHVSASREIIRDDQIKDFDKKPTFTVTQNGQVLSDYEQDVLPRGPGIVRDYARELEDYNIDKGYVVVKQAIQPALNYGVATVSTTPTPSPATTVKAESAKENKLLTIQHSSEQSLILLQADFLRLPAAQKAAFMKWAKNQ